MKFMKSFNALAAASSMVAPKDLNMKEPRSIKSVASTLAFDTMSYYKGNLSDPKSVAMGDLQDPYYWWTAGALWGAMLDYYHYTKDPSYNDVVIQALLAPTNLGPNHNYMPPEHSTEEGNDDLFFWGSAALSAAERNLPQPNESLPSWLEIGVNVFNDLKSRWDTQHCNGGLFWQIFPDNPNGIKYKNSVSNGGFFQLAARLARATGDATYLEWAERIWGWSMDVGFIDPQNYHIYDGADKGDNCTKVNTASFTYTTGIYLYGAAVLANHTDKPEWRHRAEKILDGASWFFSPPGSNGKNIMYEAACETVERCNADMTTHKGYLARFMWQSVVMMPSLRSKVEGYLLSSITGAVASCTGGKTGRECGMKWYTGTHDNNPGLGQEMCALEIVQGLLIQDATAPMTAKEIKTVRQRNW